VVTYTSSDVKTVWLFTVLFLNDNSENVFGCRKIIYQHKFIIRLVISKHWQKLKVVKTSYPIPLFKFSHHDNCRDLLFPDHPPKVIERFYEWTLVTMHIYDATPNTVFVSLP